VARKPLDGTVTLLQRISNSVRRWLGVEILLAIESRVSLIHTTIRDIEAKDVTRHEELLGAINRLSTILTNAHLTEPPMFHAPVLDWEQVQADALAQLEREMEK
jgi:hypothetical protein